MSREFEIRNINKLTTNSSHIVICDPKEASNFVEKLLIEREKTQAPIMTLVLDGEKIEPQNNFVLKAQENDHKRDQFSRGYRKYHVDKSVNAGLFVAILNKTIEESKKWSVTLGKEYNTSWEEKIASMVSRFRWTETDKIDSACTALEYTQKAVNKLSLAGANLLILNFDKMNHYGYGARLNLEIEDDLIKSGYEVDVILFRQSKPKTFKLSF